MNIVFSISQSISNKRFKRFEGIACTNINDSSVVSSFSIFTLLLSKHQQNSPRMARANSLRNLKNECISFRFLFLTRPRFCHVTVKVSNRTICGRPSINVLTVGSSSIFVVILVMTSLWIKAEKRGD